MSNAIFDQLQETVAQKGSQVALQSLCDQLRAGGDYDSLFYARLMAKRHELGLSPIPTSPATDLPDDAQEAFEDAIRDACEEIGNLYLKDGKLPQAWTYFRMIGAVEPMGKALAAYEPADEDEQMEDLIQIALNDGVLPRKGFDWILDRFGICSAITTLGSGQLPGGPEVRQYCVGRAARNLYEELRERLISDVEQHEGKAPPEAEAPPGSLGVVRKLIQGRDFLFGDDCYHVDLSHLSNAVQMSLELPAGEDLEVARELCEYGERLSGGYQVGNEPPFEDQYKDYGIYLAALAGERQDEAVAHFRAKAESNPVEEAGTAPAEVLVQLLQRLDRPKDAAEAARKYLAEVDAPRLAYVAGLCEQAKAYDTLIATAREQNNPVQFMAGLLAKASQ